MDRKMERRDTELWDIFLENFDEPLTPDHELLVWEKWIQIRKEETTKLGKKLKRAPVDLTMNLTEKIREDKERKTVIEQAQIDKKLTTFRGAYFEHPPRLAQHCICEPVYEVQRTRAEVGRPKPIEHVGIPTYIQKEELGMSGEPRRKDCHQLEADYKKYREKREYELRKKIVKIDPFRPATSQLMVHGHKPKTPPPKIPEGPLITFDEPPNDAIKTVSGIHALRINKSIFYKNIPGQNLVHIGTFDNRNWREKCNSWLYYFNVPIGKIGRGKLCLQNLGTVALRYCWKNIRRPITFIPETIYEQVFFFNKNEDVISPGQCKDICFSFISEKADIYAEFWELSFLNVQFFDTPNKKIIIELYADSVDNTESITNASGILKRQIERNSLYRFGNELINEMVDSVFVVVPQTYPYKKYFLERELFVMKNPVCYYHQTEVAKLKDIYNKELVRGKEWDLSIATWRKAMMMKEFPDRMKYYDLLKQGHNECLKPWSEGDGLLKDKYRAITTLLKQLADNLDKGYERISSFYAPAPVSLNKPNKGISSKAPDSSKAQDAITKRKISNIFYLYAYDHVATTMELCAGVLSSLDSNKWIDFDFCRH